MKEDRVIRSLMYGDVVKRIAEERNIGLTEARMLLSQMSFTEYHKQVVEASADITPPSGNTIGPNSGGSTQMQKANGPTKVKSIWPGQGAPVEVGMTVGIKDQNGLPVPGQISQVDAGSKGVKVKNPSTGQDEWRNTDELEPFMAQGQDQQQTIQPGTQPRQQGQQGADLTRLQELAGIRENCSAGATGSGGIAVAAMPMGKMKRRQETDEQAPPVEYTPKEPAKTIVGDTKPAQASGKLSADLAARGKKTAARTNNGFKR